jgi:branched-chain amino acid aminotransferase
MNPMQDNAGQLFMHDDVLDTVKKLDNIRVPDENVIYEVIRIITGTPLFLEDHYLRMKNSCKLINLPLTFSQQELDARIRRLVSESKLAECNVKVVVFVENDRISCLLYVSRSYYPNTAEVEKGIRTSLLEWERENPNAKVVNQTYKEEVARKMKESQAFEVLLVNSRKKITEGSRSNIFFVKGDKVFTSPGEYVLKGVTRQYIIDACSRLGLELIETLIGVESLQDIEGAFLSGTSIKVLPIAAIDDVRYESGSHPAIVAIRNQFDRLLEEYVQEHKEK